MEALQEQVERAVADHFFDWFNNQYGTAFVFERRAGEAPDLVYVWERKELQIEITSGYYNPSHAEFVWSGMRKPETAVKEWSGVNPDKALAEAICQQISNKCQMRYGPNTLLLINVPPGGTTAEDLSELLSNLSFPEDSLFVGIYVCGRFPMTLHSSGGYRVLCIKDMLVDPAFYKSLAKE